MPKRRKTRQVSENLKDLLSRSQPDGAPLRLAVVGVGQIMRGDDGAGSAVARLLKLSGLSSSDEFAPLIIDAGHAPENCLGPVVRFRPDAVLFIDAARAGAPPGTLVWLRAEEAESVGGSTHTLSLAMLGRYLAAETGASVYVIGIQPASTETAGLLSPAVEQAVVDVAGAIALHWRTANTASSAITAGDRSVVNT